MVQIQMSALLRRPLTLSCLLHGVVILGACALFSGTDWQVDAKPPAEVVMEVAAEDLPERSVPLAVRWLWAAATTSLTSWDGALCTTAMALPTK